AMSLPLSQLFFADNPYRYATGVAVIVPLCVLNLVPIPYMTHRGHRAMQTWVKVLVAAFFAAPAVMFLADRPHLFDVFFVGAGRQWIPGPLPRSAGGERRSSRMAGSTLT